MIKILGATVFVLIGAVFLLLGFNQHNRVLMEMGGLVILLVVGVAILVRLFPDFFESKEHAEMGEKIIKKVVQKASSKEKL